jgi:hypothetical protein
MSSPPSHDLPLPTRRSRLEADTERGSCHGVSAFWTGSRVNRCSRPRCTNAGSRRNTLGGVHMQSRLWLFIMQSSAVQMVVAAANVGRSSLRCGPNGRRSERTAVAGRRTLAPLQSPKQRSTLSGSINRTTSPDSRSIVHQSGATGTYTLLTTTAANATGHQSMAVASATQYCYQVRAVRVSGNRKSYSCSRIQRALRQHRLRRRHHLLHRPSRRRRLCGRVPGKQ